MTRRRRPPARPRLHVEELEPRLLYSADAALLLDPTLGGAVEMRLLAPPPAPSAAPALQALAALDDATQRRELLVVDARVTDPYAVLDRLAAQRGVGASYDLVVLEPERAASVQLAELLRHEQGLGALHLVGWDAAALAQPPDTVALAEGGEVIAWQVAPGGELHRLGAGATTATTTATATATAPATAAAAPDTLQQPLRRELIFVDSRVEDLATLLQPLIDAAPDEVVFELVHIDAGADGIAQIGAALAGREGIDALHLISHGASGALLLGRDTVDAAALAARADEVAAWSAALDAEADLLLYGCEVAADAAGEAFVEALAGLTGADVAASTDATGAAAMGGDWALEHRIGRIESAGLAPLAEQAGWQGLLAVGVSGAASATDSTNTANLTWSHTVASGSNRVLIVTLAIDNLGSGVSSVTYGGVALTQVGRTAGNHAVEIWRLVAPTVGTANVVVTLTGNTAVAGGAQTFVGVDQSQPTRTYGAASGTGTTASVVVGSAAGDLVVDAQYWDGNPAGGGAGLDQTIQWWRTNIEMIGGSTTEAGAASVTMSGSFSSSTQWEIGAVSLRAAPNVAPVITSNGGGASASVSVAETRTAVTTVTSTDADGGTPVYSIAGGLDAAKFTLDASTGALAFITAPDFEAPTDAGGNNVYDVTVQVSDGAGGSDTQAIAVTVTDVSSALLVNTASESNDSGITAGNAAHTAEWLNAQPGADGKVSLREAILAANNTAGLDTIGFSIGAGGVQTIAVSTLLPDITDAVVIDGTTQPGFAGTPLIVLDGSSVPAGTNPDPAVYEDGDHRDGLRLYTGSDGSTIRGLVIRNFAEDAIDIAYSDGNVVVGNYLGTDVTGMIAAGGYQGVNIWEANHNRIGGSSAADRNLISGNVGQGVYIGRGSSGPSASGNEVIGNWIGLNATGSAALGNQGNGVLLTEAGGNRVGSAAAGEGNVISGNQNGVVVFGAGADGNWIQGNRIGTDASGMAALGNQYDGVHLVDGAGANRIGGAAAGEGNLISGNGQDGVQIAGEASDGNIVQGNWIGVNAAGTAALGNGGDGIFVSGGADDNLLGGAASGEGNWIASPGLVGIEIDGASSGNQVQGNRIGTDLTGSANWGAQENGILLEGGAADNLIGGTADGAGNQVAYSGRGGVWTSGISVSSSAGSGNALLRNSVTASVGIGIDLGSQGVTANDAGDTDSGANDLLNFPVLWSANSHGGATAIVGQLDAVAGRTYRIEFFANAAGSEDASGYGEGATFLGAVEVSTDGSGRAAIDAFLSGVSLVAGSRVSATATEKTGASSWGSSSEFAMNVISTADAMTPQVGVPPSQSLDEDTPLTFSVANGNAITVSDGSPADGRVQVSLSVGQGSLTLAGSAGLTVVAGADGSAALVIDGLESAVNAALDGLVFTPAANQHGTVNLQVQVALAADLAGRYGFDDGSAADLAAGTAQNGTLIGNATGVVDATRGNVLALDGNGDAVQIAGTFGNPSEVTLGGWVNFSGAGRQEFVSLDDRVHIALDDGASGVKGSIQVGAGSWIDLPSGLQLSGSGWHHVMYSYSDSADRHALYIDGVEVASATVTDSIDWVGAGDSWIGVHPPSTALWLNGRVDDVRIYTRALDAAEVAGLAAEEDLATAGVTLEVAAVNDAPSLSTATALPSIAEDTGNHAGFLVSLLASGATDADSGALQGIAVTGVDDSHGTWQYTLDGSSWVDIGPVSDGSARLLPSDATARIRFVPDPDWNGSTGLFEYRAWDQTDGVAGALADTTVNGGSTAYSFGESGSSQWVSAVNDAPVNLLPGTQLTAVNTPLVLSTANGNAIQVADVDAGAAALRIELSVTHGSLTLAQTSGLSFSVGDGSADAAMTFTGTLADVNAALNGATFTPTAGYRGSALLTLASNDQGSSGGGGALGDSDVLTIAVGGARFQDGVDGYSGTRDTWVSTGSPSVDHGSDAEVMADDDSATDAALLRFEQLFGSGAGQIPWGATIESATLSVYVTDPDAADAVSLHRMLVSWSEASTYNSLTGGVGSAAGEIGPALLSFDSGVSGWNSLSSAGLTATVQAWADGGANHGWAFVSNNADLWTFASSENGSVALRPYLTVTYSLPQAPVLTASGGMAGYVENAAPVAVDPGLTVSDADSTQLSSAVIRIGTGYASGQDQLQFTDQNGITGLWNSGTGTLTLSGTASLAQYQTALRSVAYVNSSDTPATDTRTVEFSVTDAVSGLTSGLVSRSLTVQAVNDAPTLASPIADQAATEDSGFSFQLPAGTFADVDAGDSLSYSTSALPSWLQFDAATRTFSGTPTNADVGTVTVTVTATDGTGATASDSFDIVVGNVNDAPTLASPIADQSATEDAAFSFQLPAGTFADVDAGDSLSYSTSALPSWLQFDAATRTFGGTPTNADVGTVTVTVTATDGSGAMASDSFDIVVGNVNDVPTLGSPIADQSATEDSGFSFQLPGGTFADVDAGDSLSYSTSALPSWLNFNAATRTFSGTPANGDVGTVTVTVTATDGSGATASDSFDIVVGNVNDAPTLASPIADQSATEDDAFSFQLPGGTFADVDAGDSLSYSTSALPSWLQFDAVTRTFSGTPTNADVGTVTVTVTATDGSGATASDSFDIVVGNINDAPTLASPIADQSATEDSGVSFQLPAGTFADVDAGDSLSYSTSALPSWLQFDAVTRTFSGTPANADVGTFTITVTATDGTGATASDSFDIVVGNINDAPTLASPIADQSATEDQAFTFELPAGTFADVDAGDSLSYSTSALPGWLSFDAVTRTFSGTPANADVGTVTITVTATDGTGAMASDSFDIVVGNINDAPTLASPIADQSATEDDAFSFQLPAGTFADVDAGDSLSYSTSALPSWLQFDAVTRTFSGTPTNADVGTVTVTVTATDGTGATASDSFDIVVGNVNDAPTLASPIANQSATEDDAFSFQLPAGTFADVDAGDSLSYSTSALPSWLQFDAVTRTFSGTPANADVGTVTITVTATDGTGAMASDSFDIVVGNINDAPTLASPIADQSATEDSGFSFQLPAGTFADADAGDSLSYSTSTLPSWLNFDAVTRTFSGTPANADVGTVTITVTATDGTGAMASDSFDIVVGNINDAPTLASPIANQSATEDDAFSFQLPAGTFADADAGDSLSYSTSALPSWLNFNAATRTFSGTPANADVGTVTITVTATDGTGATTSDSFDIVVGNVNDAPTLASPIADQSATEDSGFSFQLPAGTFADADAGDSLSYSTSALPSWLQFDAVTRTFSGTPTNADVGTVTVTVTATDGSGATASDSFDIVVGNVNDAPTLASPIADQSATEDSGFSFQLPAGTFADVDAGDSLSYSTSALPSWLNFDAATRTFSGTPTNADVGTVTITVTATDGTGAMASDSFDIVVGNVNDAPTLSSPIADQSATEDSGFSFQLPAGTFADADAGDSLSYSTSALPSWLNFNAATRTFSGTPANADVGTVTITVTATDGSGAMASDSFDIVVGNVNDAPTLASPIADQSATEDDAFSFQLPAGTFADVDAGDSLSYSTSALPSWLSFNAATRTFSGTPTNADVGTVTITVTATDGTGATASDSFDIVVGNVNDAPTLASPIADQSATEDSGFSFQLPAGTFADVDAGDSLSYSTSALPSWLQFDAATRTFSGTPANGDVGTVTVTVTATDGTGATASDSFDIVVGNVNDAPTLASSIADQSATEDQAFTFELPAGTFADADAGDSLSYSTSALPSWLNFDAATRTFSGTPANADVGTVTVTVTATDGSGAMASDSFDIVVGNVNDAPTLASPIADQSATEDDAFSFQLPAGIFADADAGDSLSYSTSALPSWLNFNAATRTFSGTPTNADVGTVTVTVTATDGTGATASDSFDIVVGNINDAPTLASPIADQSATEDQAFTFELPAGTFADADAGDSLSYSTSALPSWLSFDAVTRTFSGTPANADVGTVTVTVTATDGTGATASDSFDIVVGNVNDAPTLASPIADQSATEDQAFTFELPAGTFADVDAGDSLSYSTNALPGWLQFDAATRTFSGTPTNADVGTVTVTVTATDGSGAMASDSFDIVVGNVNDAPTGAPRIIGTPTEDQTLGIDTSAIADADGLGNFSYQWQRNGSTISGATGATYTLGDADVGQQISVTVSWSDGQGTAEGLTSAAVGPIANVNDLPSGLVAIDDTTPTQGQTLNASHNIADAEGLGIVAWQWQRDGVDIAGATGSRYVTTQDDVGAVLRVVARYTDGQGAVETVASQPTAVVANVNDAPQPRDGIVAVVEDVARVLRPEDFAFDDADGDALAAVRVEALPAIG